MSFDFVHTFKMKDFQRCLQMRRLQNGGVTSDEDVSIVGSPSIRRRLGSCSGGPDQQSTKEDTYSPGIISRVL